MFSTSADSAGNGHHNANSVDAVVASTNAMNRAYEGRREKNHDRTRDENNVKKSDNEIFKYTNVCASPHVMKRT
jgi:hypothetical protein